MNRMKKKTHRKYGRNCRPCSLPITGYDHLVADPQREARRRARQRRRPGRCAGSAARPRSRSGPASTRGDLEDLQVGARAQLPGLWPAESSVKACRKAGSGIPIGPWPNSSGAGIRCMKSAWKTSGFSWCGDVRADPHRARHDQQGQHRADHRGAASGAAARSAPSHAPAEASSTPARNASTVAAGSIPRGSSTKGRAP